MERVVNKPKAKQKNGQGADNVGRCLQVITYGRLITVSGLLARNIEFFGMQVGCGVDSSTYAAAYAKNFKKQAIGCSVVLNNGTLPINLLMPL